MSFQTSCMVLVRDEQQQIKLEKWMKSIGWQVRLGKDGPCFLIANANQGQALWMDLEGQRTREIFARDFIDCGENINMFMALAAMNDENIFRQFVIDGDGNWGFCTQDDEQGRGIFLRGTAFNLRKYRKATTEEIVAHFKNSKK